MNNKVSWFIGGSVVVSVQCKRARTPVSVASRFLGGRVLVLSPPNLFSVMAMLQNKIELWRLNFMGSWSNFDSCMVSLWLRFCWLPKCQTRQSTLVWQVPYNLGSFGRFPGAVACGSHGNYTTFRYRKQVRLRLRTCCASLRHKTNGLRIIINLI